MKKKNFWTGGMLAALLAFGVMATGCPTGGDGDDGPETEPPPTTPPVEPGKTIDEIYWGEWIRMDAGATWYISDKAIKIDGVERSTPVSFAGQSFTMPSEGVIEVAEGAQKYHLYASRIANATFTGKIAGFDEASASVQRSAVAEGKGGIKVKVKNMYNGKVIETDTDHTGKFTVEKVIPGDPHEVTPEGGKAVTVTPNRNGDDVGTITIAGGATIEEVNFKTEYTVDGAPQFLYADGTRYAVALTITNVGEAQCNAPTCELSFEDGLVAQPSAGRQILGTIVGGASKTVSLSLQCGAIEEDYVDKKITITLTDANNAVNPKTWVDSVSIRFYKVSTYFYLKYVYLETASSGRNSVYGDIKGPDDKQVVFSELEEGLSCAIVPWYSSEYLVTVSGGPMLTDEAIYALSVSRFIPYSDSDFSGFSESNIYEPNNSKERATEVTGERIMAFLHTTDIDCYRFRVPCPDEGTFPIDLPLDESLTWLGKNAEAGRNYAINVKSDVYLEPQTLSYGGKTAGITLLGGAAERKVNLDSNGSLFTVGSGVTLTLGSNITLLGRDNNTASLVRVEEGGTLEMNAGSKIMDNTNSGDSGNGGRGSRDIGGSGGGVFVDGGTFTMKGGTIGNNTASNDGYGGGVFVSGGTFTKERGTIYGSDDNTYKNTASSGIGHAVYVSSGKKRDSTAAEGVTLDSTQTGGWE